MNLIAFFNKKKLSPLIIKKITKKAKIWYMLKYDFIKKNYDDNFDDFEKACLVGNFKYVKKHFYCNCDECIIYNDRRGYCFRFCAYEGHTELTKYLYEKLGESIINQKTYKNELLEITECLLMDENFKKVNKTLIFLFDTIFEKKYYEKKIWTIDGFLDSACFIGNIEIMKYIVNLFDGRFDKNHTDRFINIWFKGSTDVIYYLNELMDFPLGKIPNNLSKLALFKIALKLYPFDKERLFQGFVDNCNDIYCICILEEGLTIKNPVMVYNYKDDSNNITKLLDLYEIQYNVKEIKYITGNRELSSEEEEEYDFDD